jgi:hypothetical protein
MPRIASFAYLLSPPAAFAAEDPLARPNNFAGIHILFTHELDQAHDLVNSSGGDWGYVTIPIQAGDRDLEKWQDFMDQAKEKHIIPIIRLATEPFFKNTATWRKPDNYDLLDFANFLDSLEWPTKNRYVILFNEVNRFDEWGGEPPSPSEYAEIVAYANEVFKSRNESFYLILSGMDAAAPDDFIKYINGFTYLKDLMSDPRITDSIDGFSSHSYPNPDFGAPPMENKKVGIATYRYEYDLINSYSDKKIPVFITETGWGNEKLPDSVVSKYLTMSVKDIWSKDADKIVAVTPFLLNSVGGPFDKFSFIKNGNKRDFYKTFAAVSKVKGSPDENKNVKIEPAKILAKAESFNSNENNEEIHPFVKFYMKTLLGLD